MFFFATFMFGRGSSCSVYVNICISELDVCTVCSVYYTRVCLRLGKITKTY